MGSTEESPIAEGSGVTEVPSPDGSVAVYSALFLQSTVSNGKASLQSRNVTGAPWSMPTLRPC